MSTSLFPARASTHTSQVVLSVPRRASDGTASTLADEPAVASQRWSLGDDGLLVSHLRGGAAFCLGLPTVGRIFPATGAAVVLVPIDSKRALKWAWVGPAAAKAAQAQRRAADDDGPGTLL
jgi:hypothetical protein